jgi:DNA-binding YbaB/EbfC family protein
MFKNMGDMMKQAQTIQEKMNQIQKQFTEYRLDASSGGGLVKVTMNGKRDLVSIDIDPSLIVPAEKEVLEDLIVAALQEATKKVDVYIQDEMKKISGGMPLG